MFKSNYLVELTILLVTAKCLLFSVINIGNRSCLCISSVPYCNFNVLIAKFESLSINRWFIRCITDNAWCDYTADSLSVIIAPSCLASHIVFSTCFIEGNSLSFIWLSCIAIIIKIMNRTCYSIISSYTFSFVLQVDHIVLINCW